MRFGGDGPRTGPVEPVLVVTVAAVAILGGLTRAWVLVTPSGMLNADEAYTGLQAADILDGRVPIVIQGSAYTAVIESYVFAPFVAVFGQHVIPLKLVGIAGWALAAAVMWFFARRLFIARGAALAASLLWLAPGAMTIVSTRAYVGYALGMALVIAALWSCAVVVERDRPDWRRSAIAGAIAGAAFYVHPMFVTVLGPMIAVCCIRHRRWAREWWVPAAAGAIAVNLPFILWNAANGWPSLDQPVAAGESPFERLARFFHGLLPRALGVRSQAGEWVFPQPLAVLLLGVILGGAAVGAARLVRSPGTGRWSGMLVAAPLVVCWPLMALLTNLGFVRDARYAVIPLPFIVVALAAALEPLVAGSGWARVGLPAIAAIWWFVVCFPFLRHDVGGDWGDPNDNVRRVVSALERDQIDRVAGTYWWVLPIEYESDREIRAAVAGDPFVVRFPSSQRLVEAARPDEVAFVFDVSSDNPALLRMPVDAYQRAQVGNAILYLPVEREAG